MRISTAGMHAQTLQAMLQRQGELARTSEQISSGRRFTHAAEDPAAARSAQVLDHANASLVQYGNNAGHVQRRLELQESALTDAGDRLGRARDLLVQGNTATVSAEDRKLIAIELRQLREELLTIANRQDGAGRALFAGTRDGVVPFTDHGAGVDYAGNDARNDVDVAPGLAVADSDPGSVLFLRVPTGDGIVRGSAAAGNAGTGILKSAAVTDHGSWGGGGITVEFTAPDRYRVLDAGGNELATGDWTGAGTISAGGVQLQITGAPAAGDRFDVYKAGQRDVFATLDALADALEAPAASPADNARRTNALTAGLGDLASAQDHLIAARAGTGTRLATLDHAAESREVTALALEGALSDLRDTDYAEAASRFTLQLTALEAAQQVALRMQGMSLFDRL